MVMSMTRGALRKERGPPGLSKELADRASAFRTAEQHSRTVRMLRLLLPLAAILCLAFWTITLGARWRLGPHLGVGAVTVTADDLTMKNPSYFGQTKDGGHYTVRAKKAVVEFNREAPIRLFDIDGDLVQTNAVVTHLKAKHGLMDNAKNELELFDGIEIAASSGLKARLTRAMIYAKENRIVSNQPVEVATPTGRLSGAAMTLRTDTHEATFVGNVMAHLIASTQVSEPRPAAGAAAKAPAAPAPVDVTSDNLYVNDATHNAIFMGGVVATRGDTRLKTPELHVAYEGRGAEGGLAGSTDEQGHLTRLVATSGCVVTIGTDRRITGDAADFDAKADTALFTGNVLINQQRNVLQGQRLFIDRKAGRSRLDTPGEGGQPAGRIAATFYQNQPAPSAAKSKAAAAAALPGNLPGSFKADPNAPIDIEADTLDVYDGVKQAVFRGNVKSQQGDFLLRTVAMTAYYSGQTGLSDAPDGAPAQLTRVEAREQVLVKSKDGQTATGDWATFDIKANTVLMGDHVVVSRGKDVAQGPRLKIDLTTGMYRFEIENEPAAAPAAAVSAPRTGPVATATDGTQHACPPGKQCVLFYPKEAQEAQEKAHEKAKALEKPRQGGPEADREPRTQHDGWEPSSSASPVLRGD
jgi:lipopolysaccharide export system protein LptA